jgi:hypothetical protein
VKDELLNKVISVAYGDAAIKDKIEIYFLSLKNEDVKKVLKEHRKIALAAHKIDFEECPDNVIEKVSATIKSENLKSHSMFVDIYSIFFRRPIFISTVAAAIILAVISTFIFDRPEIKQQYTQQQIEQADSEVRYSLALVASVLNKTKNTVEKEVFEDRVNKPIRKSLFMINDYIQGDKKNESIN